MQTVKALFVLLTRMVIVCLRLLTQCLLNSLKPWGVLKASSLLLVVRFRGLRLNSEDVCHVGTVDVDLCLDPEALAEGEYASLANDLLTSGSNNQPVCEISNWYVE